MSVETADQFDVINGTVEEITIEPSEEPFDAEEAIEQLIASSAVFLFMKGNSDAPKCGFSASAVSILNNLHLDYCTFDVLSNPEIREGIKKFSNWPTIPQVYIHGEFVGGSEVLADLYQTGKLSRLIKIK